MKVNLHKKEEWFHFFDGQGQAIERKTEIRFDPLTKESSRIVFDPGMSFTPPDYTEVSEQTRGDKCPFCEENLLKMTPVFPNDITKDGRITKGEATLFPNLFPYSKHNGVVIFSGQHYVRLEEFTETMIKDALIAAQMYIKRVMENDSKARFASINWNYLPHSGGSILHPHMHIIVSETATTYQNRTNELSTIFKNDNGEDYFETLYKSEKEVGERWIGEKGHVGWIHAFAPKSHNDFMAVLPKVTSINECTEEVWRDFALSLKGIFATLSEQGLASFNMMLNFTRDSAGQPIHARLIPRLTLGQIGTSDINFFQALQQESLSYKSPEDITKIARNQFNQL
ncbi:HIT domain-containing protein [Bacillus sp. FJAT-45350]|uniref:HIT domain-containing protein n=1 Tax=Bacillus sp. FJAT-45350 TaxID=2011014 RepID=UPI000BB693A9|nr:HIT domain-containing protein [Bacillus sp. FJAT-45350]